MHQWGDDRFDWKSLDDAIHLVTSIMWRWGRIGAYGKEKYGTARIGVSFYDGSLHSLLYPGYVASQFPGWLWSWDLWYISKFCRFIRLTRLINWWQTKIYSYAYSRAIKQFPGIAIEIVCCADAPNLIPEFPSIMQKYSMIKTIRRILVEEFNDHDDSLLQKQ